MPRELIDINIQRVDLVSKAANKRRWLLFKQEEPMADEGKDKKEMTTIEQLAEKLVAVTLQMEDIKKTAITKEEAKKDNDDKALDELITEVAELKKNIVTPAQVQEMINKVATELSGKK